MVAYIVLGIVAVLLAWFGGSYNRFVRQYQTIVNSWSNVDTELQRRYDLVPNLVNTVKAYAAHEAETLRAVIEARTGAVQSTGDPHDDQEGPERLLVSELRHLLAVSEAYPDLQADMHFLELQRQLVTTENRIQATRRLYNGNIREYNQRVETVPSRLVAAMTGFSRKEYFEIPAAISEAGAPAVSL
ncbi:MAG: LemA family protein [Acidimicrobiales bacterium]|nr:LemA family protein [Acidimicrobiales bacterium]